MSTAIDSSVLWSVFRGESDARAWVDLLVFARRESSLVVCDVVFAEITPFFRNLEEVSFRLESLGIEYDAVDRASAFMAGEVFKTYRKEGGPRVHFIPDFIVGAHALNQAGSLAARDRGYLRRYFPQLRILAPESF